MSFRRVRLGMVGLAAASICSRLANVGAVHPRVLSVASYSIDDFREIRLNVAA